MIGFDGDEERQRRLRAELDAVLAAFPRYLEKSRSPTWFDPGEVAMNDRFDAIVRAHAKDRLRLPVVALSREGATYHNLSFTHLRRLAWFVPSLLAAWLEAPPAFLLGRFGATSIKQFFEDMEIVEGKVWGWNEREAAALASFFDAALSAALATPAPPPPADPFDGLPPRAFETVRLAEIMHVPTRPLVEAWVREHTPLADRQLADAFDGDAHLASRLLSHGGFLGRLETAFFASEGERAARLSAAIEMVRYRTDD